MLRFSTTILVMILLLAFGILFGVDIATKGIEQVHGPVSGAGGDLQAVRPVPQLTPAPVPRVQGSRPVDKAEPQKLEYRTSTVTHVFDKFGRFVQITADHGLRFVVSLLDKLLD
ncbi:hypothetical protein [Ferviditalea candida]|uniref:Uncharacterized protein n=1 Tax=Ferviditalea candida TaxID=3108399 RepID=A0ABU5ZE09_9BACL|nr:hypothetical protein [Paenibacillaceae bacterium T2]